jgi:hypothetical protein
MEIACKEFFDSLEKHAKSKKPAFLRRSRKPVSTRLAERLTRDEACDLESLSKLITDLSEEWKSRHRKVCYVRALPLGHPD